MSSIYRNIWSTQIWRKEEIATSEKEKVTTEQPLKSNEQCQIDDLLTALEELKNNRDELNVS